jgi:RND family efflux transporter MFP subunit
MFAPAPNSARMRPFIFAAAILLLIALTIGGRMYLAGRESTAQTPAQPTQRGQTAAVVQTTQATTGPIRASFSYAGGVQAADQVSLVPRTSGIVRSIPVEVGQRVTQGQTLAVLDPGSLTDQVEQAKAGVTVADAKLKQILIGAKPEDVEAARAQLGQAQARLDLLQQQGRPEDILAAQASLSAQQAKLDQMLQGGRSESIAQAQAQLDSANAKLALVLQGPTQDQLQAARSAIESDRASVSAATAALLNLQGTSNSDVRAAESTVESDRASLRVAQIALDTIESTYAADLQAAQAAYDSAVTQRNQARMTWDQTRLGSEDTQNDAEAKVASAQANVNTAQANLTALDQGVDRNGACTKDTKTGLRINAQVCTATMAAARDTLNAAQLALDNAKRSQTQLVQQGGSALSQMQMQGSTTTAEANLRSASARLDALRTKSLDVQRSQLEAQLQAAREKLASSETRLAALVGTGIETQQRQLESTLVASQERQRSDQAKLDELLASPKPEEVQQAQASVRDAEQRLALAVNPSTDQDIRAQAALVEQAQQQLDKAMRPFTVEDIRQQEQVVAQMRANLAGRANPFTSADVEAAVAAVEQARAQLAVAQTNYDQTILPAPFSGVVGQKLLTTGAFASAQTPILTLVGPSAEVHITVEEARVGVVRPGQAVQLDVAAYPNEVFTGRVTTIAPTGDARAHTFDVTIIPDNSEGRLMPGMFAQVRLTAVDRVSATLIPKEAVIQQDAGSIVYVVEEGRAHLRQVQVGVSDDKNIEIVAGLEPGEQVVVVGSYGLKDNQPVQIPGERRSAPAGAGA